MIPIILSRVFGNKLEALNNDVILLVLFGHARAQILDIIEATLDYQISGQKKPLVRLIARSEQRCVVDASVKVYQEPHN